MTKKESTTTALVVSNDALAKVVPEGVLDTLSDNPLFASLSAESQYPQEVAMELLAEDPDGAKNFVSLLSTFCPPSSDNDFMMVGGMSLDDEEEDEASKALAKELASGGSDRLEDPIPIAKLVQNMTRNKPKGVTQGCFVDTQSNTLAFRCWDDENSIPVLVPGYVLGVTMSNSLFDKDSGNDRPVCWAKDAQVSKNGSLCRNCPEAPGPNGRCQQQILVAFIDAGFTKLYKVPFASTALKKGKALFRTLKKRQSGINGKSPFEYKSILTVTAESNPKGAWMAPKVDLTLTPTAPAAVKALRILAQMHITYLRLQWKELVALSQKYKAKASGAANPAGPGVPAGQLPPGAGSVGVDSDFFSGSGQTDSAAAPPIMPTVDTSKL